MSSPPTTNRWSSQASSASRPPSEPVIAHVSSPRRCASSSAGDDVRGRPARRDRERDVARVRERDQLAREDVLESDVVRDGGDRGDVVRERDRRPAPLEEVAGDVLRVRRGAAVAERDSRPPRRAARGPPRRRTRPRRGRSPAGARRRLRALAQRRPLDLRKDGVRSVSPRSPRNGYRRGRRVPPTAVQRARARRPAWQSSTSPRPCRPRGRPRPLREARRLLDRPRWPVEAPRLRATATSPHVMHASREEPGVLEEDMRSAPTGRGTRSPGPPGRSRGSSLAHATARPLAAASRAAAEQRNRDRPRARASARNAATRGLGRPCAIPSATSPRAGESRERRLAGRVVRQRDAREARGCRRSPGA